MELGCWLPALCLKQHIPDNRGSLPNRAAGQDPTNPPRRRYRKTLTALKPVA